MGDPVRRFRTVLFGGFHKKDVMDYITTVSRENQSRLSGQRERAEHAEKERSGLAERFESAEQARKKSAAECERLASELAARTAALERAQRELAGLKAEHTQAAQRLAELEEKLPQLELDAASYAALKDHTATIELEAHRKAKQTEERARERAGQIRGELEQWLGRVHGSYQQLRGDVTATVERLTHELEQCGATLKQSAPAFLEHDQALAGLMAHGGQQPEEEACPKEEGEHG